jgi:hypothetical protein
MNKHIIFGVISEREREKNGKNLCLKVLIQTNTYAASQNLG